MAQKITTSEEEHNNMGHHAKSQGHKPGKDSAEPKDALLQMVLPTGTWRKERMPPLPNENPLETRLYSGRCPGCGRGVLVVVADPDLEQEQIKQLLRSETEDEIHGTMVKRGRPRYDDYEDDDDNVLRPGPGPTPSDR